MNLKELQQWMKTQISLVGATGLSPGRVPLAPTLNLQGGEEGIKRLSVYANGYIARTLESLKEVYEATCHIIGEKNFVELSEHYASKYPSQHYNMTFFGRHLPEYLIHDPLTQKLSFLPDLAKLEWQICMAFHSFDQSPLDPQSLTKLSEEDWQKVRFVFQPSVSLLASPWPVLDIWNARETPRKEIDIDLNNRPQNILISRSGLHVHAEAVDAREWRLLEGLLAGKTLETVCGEFAPQMGEDTYLIQEWFSRWTQAGLITATNI